MPRATGAVSRKDFLRLSGAWLAGAALLEQFSKRMVPLVETRRVPSLLY
jgi:hypothetical protein